MRKIRWVEVVLVIILTLFITGSVWAEEFKNITKKFTCKNIEIEVLTQFSNEGNIQLQRIIFIDKTTMRKIREINNEDYPLEKISCLKSSIDGKYYLEFYYTSGGSCILCEYYELYDEQSRLVASDKEKIYLKITDDKMGKILPKKEARNLERIIEKYRDKVEKLKLKKKNEIWIKED